MEYIKEFKDKSKYLAYIKSDIAKFPNVSLIDKGSVVKYRKGNFPISVSFTASQEQTLKVGFNGNDVNFDYSYDETIWEKITSAITPTFGTEGKKTIYLRGKNLSGITTDYRRATRIVFLSSGSTVEVGGNIMGLIDWENEVDTIPCISCFAYLFENNKAIASVPKDFLPVTKLINACYMGLFKGCTSLTSVPDLPATELFISCYNDMFNGCSNLKKAPYLPAKILAPSCYLNMFLSCNQLNEVHCDAEDISASNCTRMWMPMSSTGDFYGKTVANWTTGINGIPATWTKHLD